MMAPNSLIIHEEKGEISLIEINTWQNLLPVSTDTYLRIIFSLAKQGYVRLPSRTDHLIDSAKNS